MKGFSSNLLEPDEPSAFEFVQGNGQCPFVLICDHAGRRIPRVLGNLGLSEADLSSHIAWDIGIRGVASGLASRLGAFVIYQTYSRLVIDCNRPLDAADSIVSRTAGIDVPGNQNLSVAARELRAQSVFRPYHEHLQAELDRRDTVGQPTILIAMHSFTPVFMGIERPWHAGVLYNRDRRLALPLLSLLRSDESLVVGDNQPYAVSDSSDYSIVTYGEQRSKLHVEIEIRQDLILDVQSQNSWAERIRFLLLKTLAMLEHF